MFIDHAGLMFPEVFGLPGGTNVFRVIGRLAFPIFVFLLAEGFRHTKSPARFLARLGAFAVISEIPYDLAFNAEINFFADTNIFYTLFLGGAAIFVYENLRGVYISALPVLFFMWAAVLLGADYGAEGVLFIFLMYAVAPITPRLAVMAVFCVLQHWFIFERLWLGLPVRAIQWWLIPATLAAVPLVALYNKKRGAKAKWLFYAAYPLHLLIFTLLAPS